MLNQYSSKRPNPEQLQSRSVVCTRHRPSYHIDIPCFLQCTPSLRTGRPRSRSRNLHALFVEEDISILVGSVSYTKACTLPLCLVDPGQTINPSRPGKLPAANAVLCMRAALQVVSQTARSSVIWRSSDWPISEIHPRRRNWITPKPYGFSRT